MRFSLGVNYWPRRSAMAMWRRFDAGEIREDFTRIAGLGLDTVRFFLRWDDFQPRADEIDPTMLARLEAVADIAAETGLSTMPTLYTGSLLEVQLLFAHCVGRRLHAHPAVFAWDLGNEFSNLREPASERDAAEWSRRLTAALEEASAIPVTAGTHGEDLTRDRNIRLSSLCPPFAFATMHGYSVYSAFARSRLDPEVVPFLALLAASFSHKPVLFTEFGNPTCPPGKLSPYERVAMPDKRPNPTISPEDPVLATYACLDEGEMAAYCTGVLERLHADGRLGAYWWCWADYAEALRGEPPFDHAPHELSFGIVRSDGSEKPVAAALAAFASERRTVREPNDMPLIAEVYYYRTLPRSTATLYDAFVGSVEERRSAAR